MLPNQMLQVGPKSAARARASVVVSHGIHIASGLRVVAMFDLVKFYLFGFGVLTIAGGVMGFVKAKSRASLIAGSISGALLILAGYLVGTNGRLGLFLGLGVSAALAARFVSSYRKSKKVMPAGLMAVLGVVGVVFTGLVLARP